VIDLGSAFIVTVWLYVDSGRLDSPWSKDLIFQPPPIVKMLTILGKSPTFFESPFSCERDRQPALKFDMDLNELLIYRLIPRTHELVESPTFFKSHFSPEWDRQPGFKFNIQLYVLLIYRLIPRTHGLLGCTTTFGTIPINRFLGSSFSVHDSTKRQCACFCVSVDRYTLYDVACKI
jgi:hypothetical protein